MSGGTAPQDRPGLATVLDRLASGDLLVVATLDRLGRSAIDVIGLARQAEHEGWHVVILDLGLDTTTAVRRFTLTILAGVAELERDLIRQRTREALAAAQRRGVWLGRPRENPQEVVDQILAMRAQGLGLVAIADELTQQQVPTAGVARVGTGRRCSRC